ncbi:MAG: hypothetical protein VB007_08595 [Methanocorpusculum sp.]|nr:hypothetical protein [Methanocorpusculum sp.]
MLADCQQECYQLCQIPVIREEVRIIAQKFTLYIGDLDKHLFDAFAKTYRHGETSRIILGLIRKHMKEVHHIYA